MNSTKPDPAARRRSAGPRPTRRFVRRSVSEGVDQVGELPAGLVEGVGDGFGFVAVRPVCAVASATEVMFCAMMVVLVAASLADRPISLVVAACSSTAPAMVVW